MFNIDSETIFHNIKSVIGDKKPVYVKTGNDSDGIYNHFYIWKRIELKWFEIIAFHRLMDKIYLVLDPSTIMFKRTTPGYIYEKLNIDGEFDPKPFDFGLINISDCEKLFANDVLNFFGYKDNEFDKWLSSLTLEKLDKIYAKHRMESENAECYTDMKKLIDYVLKNDVNYLFKLAQKCSSESNDYNKNENYSHQELVDDIYWRLFNIKDIWKHNLESGFDEVFPVIPILTAFEQGIIEGFKPISVIDFIKKYCKVDIEKKLGQLEIESVQKEFLPFTYKLCEFVDRKDLETFMKSYMLDIQTLLVTPALEKINYIDPFKVRDKYEEEHKQLQELTQQLDATKKELQTKITDNNEQEVKIELQSKEIDTLKESVAKLTTEKSDLQKEYDELAAKYNDLKSKIADLL